MEQNYMGEKKKGKGNVFLIVILFLLVIGLGGYIVCDKFLSNNEAERYYFSQGTYLHRRGDFRAKGRQAPAIYENGCNGQN